MARPNGKVIAVVAGAVALVAGVGLVVAAWPDGGRSVERTVEDFFAARSDGGCDELADLARAPAAGDEDAAAGGDVVAFSSDEMTALCEGLGAEDQPQLHDVDVLSEEDGEAVVAMAVTATSVGRPTPPPELPGPPGLLVNDTVTDTPRQLVYEQGRVVREDSDWRVVADDDLFALAPTADDIVADYLAAYRAGDCEAQLEHLTEDAWSDGGERDREGFVAECEASAERRGAAEGESEAGDPADDEDSDEVPADLPPFYEGVGAPASVETVAGYGESREVVVHWFERPDERLPVVQDGPEWQLDEVPDVVETAELSGMLPQGPELSVDRLNRQTVYTGGSGSLSLGNELDRYVGDDGREHLSDAGFARGLIHGYGARPDAPPDARVEVLLYEFDGPEGASGYGDHLGQRVVDEATRSEDRATVDVPGVDHGLAIITNETTAVAVGVHGPYVVAALWTDFDRDVDQLLDEVVDQVNNQIDRL